MVTAAEFVAAARTFKGGWYRQWTGAYPENGPPGYMDFAPGYYTPSYFHSEGAHCAGFVNLACQACGLYPGGLTRWWTDHAWTNGGVAFDPSTPGRPGAMAIRGWTHGTGVGVAEGHIVIYVGEHEIIHCTPGRGVVEGDTDYGTHEWADYEVYFEPPWLDFSDADSVTVQSSPWVAPDKNGRLVLNGEDWKKNGWFWVPESWHPPSA